MRKEKPKGKGCCELNPFSGFNFNKVVLFLASLVMLIALALGVNATQACNLTNPTTVSELTALNITYNATNAANNMSVAIFAKSANTANSSYSLIANKTNQSNLLHMNFTVGSDVVFEDNNVVSMFATCYLNSSGTIGTDDIVANSSVVTGITWDRTRPQAPTSVTPTGTLTSRDQTISSTVTGANTTSCTLRFIGKSPGYSAYGMTHSSNTCSLAFTNIAETTYSYVIDAEDGTNTSRSGENTMTIDIRTSTAKKAYIASGGQLPTRASATAQQNAKGQQAGDALDRAIAKAPVEAQAGLTKAKEAVTNQYKGVEAVKTWSGTIAGCVGGVFIVPVIGVIPGCIVGHLVGAVI